MANAGAIKGAVPVLAMPFDADGAIDEESLRRELDFCLEAGAQAICFGMGSESAMLTDAERRQVWSLAAQHLDGAVPLVAATAHASREGTIALTRLARECGVDCAMVNPQPLSGDRLVALFRDLSERVGLPLMVQDVGGNAPADVILRAVEAAPHVVSAKLESPGAPLKIGAVVAGLRERGLLAGNAGGTIELAAAPARPTSGETGAAAAGAGRQVTVLGGANGNWLPEESEHGAVGTMPHPAVIDAFRRVCDRYAADDAPGGYQTYLRLILPVLRVVSLGAGGPGDAGGAMLVVQKTILQRAGVIRTTYCRMPAGPVPTAVVERVWRHVEDAGLLAARRR
jgi:4-hydroxy-tetrahydrodipicolinate synthase